MLTRKKIIVLSAVSLSLALLLVLVFKFDSILVSMGDFLIVNEQPRKSDVIIVLGGNLDRVTYGVKLYQSGYADKVLLSGGNDASNNRMKQQALSTGVPDSAILQEDQSRTTFENAKYSLEVIHDQGYKSVIVVTSPFHTRRASIIFNQVFRGIKVTTCSVPYGPSLTHRWWEDSYSRKFVISEYLKLVWHYLFEWY